MMLWKVFLSCALLASLFKITHSANCRTALTPCDAILRLNVQALFDRLVHGQVTPDQLSANCSVWLNCTTFMRTVGCTWDDMNQTLLDVFTTWNRTNTFFLWYYGSPTQLIGSMIFICDNASQGYASYFHCYSKNAYYDAHTRCDAIVQAKYDYPFDPYGHYCDYERETATCFYRATNGTCIDQSAFYFASCWFKYADTWIGNNICHYNVTELLITSAQEEKRSCDVDGFFYCSSKMPYTINAAYMFWHVSLFGEQSTDCCHVTRYGKRATILGLKACSDWNSFLSCSTLTGCNVRSDDIENVMWSLNKDVWSGDAWQMSKNKQRIYKSFDMYNYTCGEGRGLIRRICQFDPPGRSARMCQSTTRMKLRYPYYKVFDICRVIFEDAVCMYKAASAKGCNDTYASSTVEVRKKFLDMWYPHLGLPLYAPISAETCGLDFAAVKNASYAVIGDRCQDTIFIECLAQSNVSYAPFYSDYDTTNVQLLNGLLNESWFSTNCKTWEAFHTCWQCNNAERVYNKVDLLPTYMESNGVNRSGHIVDEVAHIGGLLTFSLTPRRMDLLCFANLSELLMSENCVLESGGFFNNIQSCMWRAYTTNGICSMCERCFRGFYSSIVARCSVKTGVFMLKSLMAEWTPYLQKNRNCLLKVSDIVPQCDEFGCTALLRAYVDNCKQLLTTGQLSSVHLTTVCSLSRDSSSCITDAIRVGCNITDASYYRALVDDVTPYLCETSKQQAYLTYQACYATQVTSAASTVSQFFSGVNCSATRASFFSIYATLNSSCGQSTAEAVTGLAAQLRIIAALPPSNTTWCPNVIHPFESAVPRFHGPFYKTNTSFCLDFNFICLVNYSSSTADDGARFDVSLTFDGQLATSYKITNSTQLEVIFTKDDIRGHFGTTVSCAVRSYWDELPSGKSDFVPSAQSYFVNDCSLASTNPMDTTSAAGRTDLPALLFMMVVFMCLSSSLY